MEIIQGIIFGPIFSAIGLYIMLKHNKLAEAFVASDTAFREKWVGAPGLYLVKGNLIRANAIDEPFTRDKLFSYLLKIYHNDY